MITKIKKIAEVILVAIIFGFIASASFLVFRELFIVPESTALHNFQGAFMGAFFAFLFVRLGEGLTKIYERRAKNHTALVRLQYNFNDCLNIISDNIYLVDTYFAIFNGYGPNATERKIFGNVLHPAPIEKDLVVSLMNIELINKIYSLHVDLRKLNDSINTINNMIGQTTRSFIEKHIDHQTYATNIDHHKILMNDIKKFSFAAKKDITSAYAATRVLLQDENFLARIIGLFTKKQFTRSQKQKIQEEIKKLESEIEQCESESGSRIEAIQKGTYTE